MCDSSPCPRDAAGRRAAAARMVLHLMTVLLIGPVIAACARALVGGPPLLQKQGPSRARPHITGAPPRGCPAPC
ncbi:MAG: hypothetical protein J3K34DRAFT_445987, partial [Monoraphidium minutum]